MGKAHRRHRVWIRLAATAGVVGTPLALPLPAEASVVCGQAITTSTTLKSDLHCPGQTALFVNASNVVVNLGGHTVSGTMAPSGFGFSGVVVGTGRTGVTVRNGTIRGFDRGVSVFPGANSAFVTQLELVANGVGVATIVDTSTGRVPERARIVANTISRTARFSGISLGGNDHRVENNTVVDTAGTGIFVFGHRSVVSGNTVRSHGSNAIGVGPTPNTPGPFVGNRIVQNQTDGARRQNTGVAISVANAASTAVENNVVENGRWAGIYVVRSEGTVVSGNQVRGHLEGILVRVGTGTVVARNISERNSVGIEVSTFEGEPTGTEVAANLARSNRGDGIRIGAPSTTVRGNTAYRNGGWGITAVAGVTDGGGNGAFANGVPQQCTPNIAC